jgi:hypothetical protein
MELQTETGSRFVALPSSKDKIVGLSAVDLLIVEEAARVEDDLYTVARPYLATTNGRTVMLSSAFFEIGFFWEFWTGRREGEFKRIEVHADQCPRISPEFLAKEKREMDEDMYMREYFCKFMPVDSVAFRQEYIEQALSSERQPLFGFGEMA